MWDSLGAVREPAAADLMSGLIKVGLYERVTRFYEAADFYIGAKLSRAINDQSAPWIADMIGTFARFWNCRVWNCLEMDFYIGGPNLAG